VNVRNTMPPSHKTASSLRIAEFSSGEDTFTIVRSGRGKEGYAEGINYKHKWRGCHLNPRHVSAWIGHHQVILEEIHEW
jgi:hypothetical protein